MVLSNSSTVYKVLTNCHKNYAFVKYIVLSESELTSFQISSIKKYLLLDTILRQHQGSGSVDFWPGISGSGRPKINDGSGSYLSQRIYNIIFILEQIITQNQQIQAQIQSNNIHCRLKDFHCRAASRLQL